MARPVLFFISVVNSILVVFILLVPVATQGQIASCVPEIKVRKNTLYTASSESKLNISCPVTYCEEIPAVGWIKIDNKNNFIRISGTNQVTITQEQTGLKDITSHMIFWNISTDDNGIYRCMISASNFSLESHNINVNVSVSSYTTNTTNPDRFTEKLPSWLLYVFICSGILGLVMIVMLISFLCINRCSGKANSRRHKNATFCPKPLSATTSGKSQEIPEEQSNIYDTPTDDLYSDALYTGASQECTAVMGNGNRSGDGSQQIVYATLQHPTAQKPSAVRQQSREQLSEYASIRIG
ncbi:B- and T-lymphocyte attenuator [Pangasianodon hypophthalmus]|uniref:B- and T-lymphocyte attenuator n=1 Tax=Pangasianodon hypophthalmus TaxID=310915 RepID=UPI000EFF26F9|nr:B- and T-lymphocyte attenuator [Pangasianodon hypophthalmus]